MRAAAGAARPRTGRPPGGRSAGGLSCQLRDRRKDRRFPDRPGQPARPGDRTPYRIRGRRWDPHTRVGWSVVLKGVAEEVKHGADPFSAALRSLPVTPLAPGERDLLLAIYPAEISGRRFRQ